MASTITVRDATDDDVPAIAAIYAHAVLHGTGTFESDPPDDAEIAVRRTAVLAAGLPYLVATDGERVVGFAYAATYRPRPAYLHTAEDSVYVDPAAAGRGVGTQLLDALVARCTAAGRRQLIAVVGDSANTASIRLHERSGFTTVGVLHDVGWKFGRWLDTVIMQVSLGDGAATPPGSGDATGGAKS